MAAEYEVNIPDSVLFDEILVRLPAKQLSVYKSVCKTWLHTIESRPFKLSYMRRHRHEYSDQLLFSPFKSISDHRMKSSSLLPSLEHSLRTDLIKTTPKPLDMMLLSELTRLDWPVWKDRRRLWRKGITDFGPWRASAISLGPIRTTGIYCIVASLRRGYAYQFPIAKISIVNPATRDYKIVNPFPPEEETARLSNCNVHHGFGLAADGDYKVVVVMTYGANHTNFLSYLYSMRQGSWKKIVDSENDMVSRLYFGGGKTGLPEIDVRRSALCPQVFLNGCWHWVAWLEDKTCRVLSFNFDNESFKLVREPPSYRGVVSGDGSLTRSWVTVLNDHLALLYHSCALPHMGVISVWVMAEYGVEESWFNVYKVSSGCYDYSHISTLVGISYSLRGNVIHIDRILLQDCHKRMVCVDEFWGVERQPGFDPSSSMFWNNPGISVYSETLERL